MQIVEIGDSFEGPFAHVDIVVVTFVYVYVFVLELNVGGLLRLRNRALIFLLKKKPVSVFEVGGVL